MFASQVKKTIDIGDVAVTIRKLNAWSLEKAAAMKQAQFIQDARNTGVELIKAFSEMTPEKTEEIRAKNASPDARYATYDRETVLRSGIESWTESVPVEEGLKDLDEETAELLYKEIIDLSVPAPEVVEAAVSKG